MESVGVFEGLMLTIDSALQAFITSYSGNLSSSLGPAFGALLALYFVFKGYSIWTGRTSLTGGEIVGTVMRVGIVGMLVLSSSIYSTHIARNVLNFGEGLVVNIQTGAANQHNTGGTMKSIDSIYEKALKTAGMVIDAGSWGSGLLPGGVLWLLGVALCGYIFFLIMISKMGLAVLLAIGPVVILFYLFDGTKQIVDLWINQIVGTIFTLLFAVLGGGVVLEILAGTVMVPEAGVTSAAMTQIALFGVGGMFMSQVSGFASAISGGVTSTVSGINDSFKGAGNALASPKTALDKGRELKAKAQSKMNKIRKG